MNTDKQTNRQIRVFISSTFRDMQAERDYLVKFIFPQLRKLCESRGVTWGEVDLRWGVTDEQAAEGKVLPICLEEIKRCRPYFIGLLGERYGWIPDSLPPDLVNHEKWLESHLHGKTSVTELEILHGVLNAPKMAGHAFFYFRDPAYLKTIAAKDQNDFTAEKSKAAEKLCALKDRIRHSGFPVHENYPGPKELGELVLADLMKVINDTWPEGSQPDELNREAIDHEFFAQSRERVYIGRQEYFDRLDTHAAANDTQPLVVLGESGSGKSALLANWVARYRQAHPEVLVLQHYIGATPYSADWAAMLRRIMGEFKRRLGIQQDIPDQPDALCSAFPNWLYMAAAKVAATPSLQSPKIIIVLDALNQLEDRDGAPDLVWLPPVLPENVRLIVSTLPGRPLDEIQKRNWPTFKVELLSAAERRKLIADYLAQHAKALNAARVERIAAAPPSANPLYLRVLLDELRLVRTHEELEERIGDYLKAESPYALYEKVIARWEHDYEGDSDLVGDTLSLLWAARRGLTETELLQAMGKDGEPLPRAKWSPLFLAMSDALVCRGGLLSFAHDYLRTASRGTYLPMESQQRQAHIHLADYFERQSTGWRRIDELPWQLAEAKEWPRLYDLLANRNFFLDAWDGNRFEVEAYWSQIEAGSALRMIEAYPVQIDHPTLETDKDLMWALGILLSEMGHPAEALRLRSALVEQFRSTGDLDGLQGMLCNQAVVLQECGNLDAALALYCEAEAICRKLGNREVLETILCNRGNILIVRGDWDGALTSHQEAEQICRQLDKQNSLANSLGNQAGIWYKRGDVEKALTLCRAAEIICRQQGYLVGLQSCLVNQALFQKGCGKLDEALVHYAEAESICRRLGNLDGLQRCLGNQGLILTSRGDLDGAAKLLKEAERICRELGNLQDLQANLSGQALVLQDRGDLDGALAKHKEEEQLSRKLDNQEAIASSIGNQALILKMRGNLVAAMALHKEEEQILRKLDNPNGLQRSLGNQALILRANRDLKGAMALLNEQARICHELGNQEDLQTALGNQALILMDCGKWDGAMELLKKKEQICRQLGLVQSLARALGNQAVILMHIGQAKKGLPLAEEAYRIAVTYGFAGLAKQFEPILNGLKNTAQS